MRQNNNPTSLDRSSLVGEWLLDGDAIDTSGNNYDGTRTNITDVASERGYTSEVADFNGSSSYVSLGNNIFTNSQLVDFSVSVIMSPDSLTAGMRLIDFEARLILVINSNGSVTGTVFGTGGSTVTTTSAGIITTGNYYHIVFKRDSSSVDIVINTIEESTLPSPQAPDFDTFSRENRVGSYFTGGDWFNGKIQLLRVYDKKISTDEIRELYLEGLRKFGPKNLLQYPELFKDCTAWFDFKLGAVNLISGVAPTISGATQTTDHLGISNQAYNFDGTDFIKTTETFTSGNTARLATRGVLFKTTMTSAGYIMEERDDGGTDNQISIGESTSGKIDFRCMGGARNTTSASYNDGNWHLAMISKTGATTATAYIDGVSVGSVAVGSFDRGDQINFGQVYNGANKLVGDISLAFDFERGMTADEVKELYDLVSSQYIYKFPKYSLPNLETNKIFQLSKAASSGTYYDQSITGASSTGVTGVTDSTLGLNNVMQFNGTSGSIDIGDTTGLDLGTGDFTINFWFKATSLANDDHFLSDYNGTNRGWYLHMNSNSGNVRMITWDGAGLTNLESGDGYLTTGEWTQLTVVREGTAIRMYKNAADLKSTTGTVRDLDNTQFEVGTREGTGFYDGDMANVQIWTEAFSQEKILQLRYSNFITD